MKAGDRLLWAHIPRDGFGYAIGVPARFVAWRAFDAVEIDVIRKDGGIVRRSVVDSALKRSSDGATLSSIRRSEQTEAAGPRDGAGSAAGAGR
jgi:hypothetical protein